MICNTFKAITMVTMTPSSNFSKMVFLLTAIVRRCSFLSSSSEHLLTAMKNGIFAIGGFSFCIILNQTRTCVSPGLVTVALKGHLQLYMYGNLTVSDHRPKLQIFTAKIFNFAVHALMGLYNLNYIAVNICDLGQKREHLQIGAKP